MRACSIEGCTRKHVALGFCSGHYQALKVHGDPLGARYTKSRPGEARAYAEAMCFSNEEDCIEWPYGHNGVGYGVMWIDGVRWYVHRFICTQVHGPSPFPKAEVRHICGNGGKKCINHKHLEWGTPQQNQQDRKKHGTYLEAEKHPSSKLTNSEVIEIYKRIWKGELQSVLADEFKVCQPTISNIKYKKIYKSALKEV